jgi:hypothetical protein
MKHAWWVVLAFVGLTPELYAAPSHFEVTAAYEPAGKPGGTAAVAVTFSPTDPDVHINELPEPRLTLIASQSVLDDKQSPPKNVAVDPEKVKPIDLTKPVRFPVALRAGAPKGDQAVSADVVYFYCSSREGWCRRGKTTVDFHVQVP